MLHWLRGLVDYWRRRKASCVGQNGLVGIPWFKVTFDENVIRLAVSAPGTEPWDDEIAWDTIQRICFKSEEMLMSDGIYLFTSLRPESHAIPIEAVGGKELWNEILRRNLFDAELAITAFGSQECVFCWPPASP